MAAVGCFKPVAKSPLVEYGPLGQIFAVFTRLPRLGADSLAHEGDSPLNGVIRRELSRSTLTDTV